MYQDIVKATVYGVCEDLKFKISEGSDKNLSCPGLPFWLSQLAEIFH